MKTIWKYALRYQDRVEVSMPKGAAIRHVGLQMDVLHVWAEVDDSTPHEKRILRVVGTGHYVGDAWRYIGSAVAHPFVWHVYEEAA